MYPLEVRVRRQVSVVIVRLLSEIDDRQSHLMAHAKVHGRGGSRGDNACGHLQVTVI